MLNEEETSGVIQHMNADHADAVLAYAQAFAECTDAISAELVGLEAHEMMLNVKTCDGEEATLVSLSEPVNTLGDARRVLIRMARDARARLDTSQPKSESQES